MSTVLTTVLITAPLAFMAGWLLGKALFRHLSITRPNPAPHQPTAAEQTSQSAAGKTSAHEPAPVAEDPGLQSKLKHQLARIEADKQAAMNDARLLKEAVAEREHQLTELRRRLQAAEHSSPPEHDASSSAAMQNVQQAKAMRALEQRAAASAREVAAVRRELVATRRKLETAHRRSRKWLSKLKPMTRQFRQQRLIISELRDELRQRELQRNQQAARANAVSHALTGPAAPPPVRRPDTPVTPEHVDQVLREREAQETCPAAADNLQELKGIGPALHRKLNDKGIHRLQQLADMTSDEVIKLGRSVGVSLKLMQKHDWRAQAQEKLGLPATSPATAAPQA